MTLARYPDIFKCAVAGAPVTSWDGHDTFYTEKFMGLPSENGSAYESSSVMHHVHNMKGRFLLVHGMIDENVHFRHPARLVNALVAARKQYELLIFPDERHMPRWHRDRLYMEERIWDFIHRNLQDNFSVFLHCCLMLVGKHRLCWFYFRWKKVMVFEVFIGKSWACTFFCLVNCLVCFDSQQLAKHRLKQSNHPPQS